MNIEEETRQVSLDLKGQLPGLEKHGRILKLDPHDIDHEFQATTAHFGTPIETPVKNLYNVGDSMLPLGVVGAIDFVKASGQKFSTACRRIALKGHKSTSSRADFPNHEEATPRRDDNDLLSLTDRACQSGRPYLVPL